MRTRCNITLTYVISILNAKEATVWCWGDVGIAIEIQLKRQPCQCMVARSSVWRDAPRQAAKLPSEAYGVHEQIPRYYTK